MQKNSIWVRSIPMMLLAVLGVAFALYGRLVKVETRLIALEKSVGEMHAKLIPAKLAAHK